MGRTSVPGAGTGNCTRVAASLGPDLDDEILDFMLRP